jgi:cephalosporin-C deacetylase-like acetyl esterase
MLTISGFALATAVFAAGELDKAVLHGETDKERATEYKPGETMTFTLSIQGAETMPTNKLFISWTRTGDDGIKETGKVPASLTEPLVVKTKLDKPGFVRLEAYVVDEKGRHFEKTRKPGKLSWADLAKLKLFFDGGAGVEPEKLQGVPEPADFDAFWAKQRARLAAVPMDVERKVVSSTAEKSLYAVRIACAGGKPVTGYLSVPKDAENGAKKYPARLETHGYSYRPPYNPPSLRGGEIVLNINAHGVNLPAFGADEAYYKDFGEKIKSNGKAYAFDPVQNSNPETAYFNGMALRVMRGLEYLKSLPGWNGKDLYASGGSQGGLQTIWAAGLDPQVTKAESSVTWCCDMGGTELGRNRGNWYIKWVPALGYYDPINIARRISKNCRTLIPRAGLGDYTCPPSGLAILFNNIPGPKKINWDQGSTHPYVPPEKHQKFSVTGNGWVD